MDHQLPPTSITDFVDRLRTQSALLIAVGTLAVIAGCGAAREDGVGVDSIENQLPVVRGSQLQTYLQESDTPVLVEFGVDFNCSRCVQTKSDIVRLRETLDGNVDVIRVDFNANTELVTQLGGTICPTYVLFDQETPVITRSFPISVDLLEGEILRQTQTSPAEAASPKI